MRTFSKFCLTFIYLSLSTGVFSQNFISENKVWNIVIEMGIDQPQTRTFIFKFSGDTVFNERTYKKLYESEDREQENWQLNSLWYERNDSLFKYSPYDQKDVLIYDFNIAENDSFYISTSMEYMYVDSVRTKQWGEEMRKHIYFSSPRQPGYQTVWRQGVGQNGLITRSSEIGIIGVFAGILCFTEKNELVYQNSLYNSCFINSQSLFIEDKLWSNTSIGTSDGSEHQSYWVKFQGDTLINNLEYKKVMRSDDSLHSNWDVKGFIREDVASQKVYLYDVYS